MELCLVFDKAGYLHAKFILNSAVGQIQDLERHILAHTGAKMLEKSLAQIATIDC